MNLPFVAAEVTRRKTSLLNGIRLVTSAATRFRGSTAKMAFGEISPATRRIPKEGLIFVRDRTLLWTDTI